MKPLRSPITQVDHTNYASDYKIRLTDDTDIDIPQVGLHMSRLPRCVV